MPLPKATLGRLELRCPPLPHTLVEALDLVNRPDEITPQRVTQIVERDPIVTARLLQKVNSAYYGLQRQISSTDRAVVLLGPVAVVGLVVGMSMLRLRSVLGGPAGAPFTRLIRHSVAVAYLARYLGEELPAAPSANDGPARPVPTRTSTSYTAGLLHDFGKIILVYNYPEQAVALYEAGGLDAHVQAADLREMERLLFGCDHAEAGEFAALRLSFPEPLTRVIALHHTPDRLHAPPETARLVRTVAAADAMARAFGYAFPEPLGWDACCAHPAVHLLLEQDLPRWSSPEALCEAVQLQHDALRAYVDAFLPHDDG